MDEKSGDYVLWNSFRRRGAIVIQIISDAIDHSVCHNEIVTIDVVDMAQAGVSFRTVCFQLREECEDEVIGNTCCEYWGTTVYGDEWRVHVAIPDLDETI